MLHSLPSSKTNNSDWWAVFKVKPLGWTNENHPQKDVAFQEDEVESNEIIIPSLDDTDNHDDDHRMSSNGLDNENNIDEEGEIHEDDNDGIPDSEGSYEYSTSSNEEEEEEEDNA